MQALIRAEVVKLVTTRAFGNLVLAAVAVTALGAFSTIVTAHIESLEGYVHEQSFFMLASVDLALFAVVLGILGVTEEFRYGSIVPTLLVTPDRARVVAAKALTFAGAGAVLAFVALGAMVFVADLFLTARGAWPSPLSVGGVEHLGAADLPAVGGLIVASALWAAIGVALGAIVRHQVAAIAGAAVWLLVVENVGASLVGEAVRYLPGQAAHGLALAPHARALLAPAAAAAVLVAYAVVVNVAAAIRMSHADIAAA